MTYLDYSIPFLTYLRPLPIGYLRLLPGADGHPWFHSEMYLQHVIVQKYGKLKFVLLQGLKFCNETPLSFFGYETDT